MSSTGVYSMRALVVVMALVFTASDPLPESARASELEPQAQSTAQLQQALESKGFYRGPIDGRYGSHVQQAVMAFRKEIGATRSFSWSNSHWDELNNYVKPWTPYRFQEPDRVEVNLTRQVLYVFRNDQLEAVLPVASGNGELYTGSSGRLVRAYTPTGDFRFTRHITGLRVSYLGELWSPWYFRGGFAIHGSSSVPAYPASHGCIRLTMWDSAWVESRFSVGMPVHVWYEPRGVGPVFEPGGVIELGGGVPCPGGSNCDTVAFQDRFGRFYLWDQIESDPAISPFYFGKPGDVAFSGDWNGDGVDTPGLYRRSDGYVYLRNSNTEGTADVAFFFGNPGDLPIAGDFDGDGVDTVSVYRPSEQRFYVVNALGSESEGLGAADYSFMFGNPGDVPFSGDFDGNGIDTIGLHRNSTGRVMYRNENSTGVADADFIFGDPGDILIAGDWNGDGIDTIAVYRPRNGAFYVKTANASGGADFGVEVGFLQGVIPLAR